MPSSSLHQVPGVPGGGASRCYTGDGASSCSTRAEGLRLGPRGPSRSLWGASAASLGRGVDASSGTIRPKDSEWLHGTGEDPAHGLVWVRIPSNLVQEGRAKLPSFCPNELGS